MIMSGSNDGEGEAGCCGRPQEQWRVLTEAVRDSADGFAATDPINASYYRRDAELFCDRQPPHDEEETSERFADAAGLRERWADRFVDRVSRIPR